MNNSSQEKAWKIAVILALLALCQLVAVLAPIRVLWALFTNNTERAFEIIKSYDVLANAVTNGRFNELISTRADRARVERRRWGCILCRLLDALDPGHCARAGKIVAPQPV